MSNGLFRTVSGIGIATAAIAILLLLGDLDGAAEELHGVGWPPVLLMSALAVVSLGVRFGRWQRLVTHAWQKTPPAMASFTAFAAGGLLIFTPGRIGEAAKSVYLRDRCGVPMSVTMPVILAERVNDVAVMALLAALGLLLVGATGELVVLGVGLGAALAIIIVSFIILRGPATSFDKSRLPWIFTYIASARDSVESMLKRGALVENAVFGSVAWLLEVMVFYCALVAAGESWGGNTILIALAIYPAASLAGALSMFPAGIGVTEGGLAGLAVSVGGIDAGAALAATLLARMAILGAVVAPGMITLPMVVKARRLDPQSDSSSGGAN